MLLAIGYVIVIYLAIISVVMFFACLYSFASDTKRLIAGTDAIKKRESEEYLAKLTARHDKLKEDERLRDEKFFKDRDVSDAKDILEGYYDRSNNNKKITN